MAPPDIKTPMPKPLSAFPLADRGRIRGVLADIDDTLTTEGRLGAAAYEALERLRAAGLLVIPITGRPAGWCDMIARFWPVDAVVGENGAFYFRFDRDKRRVTRFYQANEAERVANRARLDSLRQRILDQVPGCAVASDQFCRVADLAIDFCEDVPRLEEDAIDRIVGLFEEAGAQAKVSSIHVNGWFGTYDKLTMTRELLRREFNYSFEKAVEEFVFVGDSPNDEPMFQAFENAVGVANIAAFVDRLRYPPRYVAAGRAGAGFVELADALIAARASPGGGDTRP